MKEWLERYSVPIAFIQAWSVTIASAILLFFPEYEDPMMVVILCTIITIPLLDFIRRKKRSESRG